MEFSKTYGPIYRLLAGPQPLVVVSAPHLAKEIVRCDPELMTKGDTYQHLRYWLGNSILLNEGDEWRTKRMHLSPAFSVRSEREAATTTSPRYHQDSIT